VADPGRPERTEEREEARAARLLADRARALAVPPADAAEETVPGLAFTVGDDRYVVTLDGVLRVERIGPVARIPGAGPGVLGALSVDGRPCALLDVPAWLAGAPAGGGGGPWRASLRREGAPEPPRDAATPRRWAIVLGRRGPEVALSADRLDLVRIPAARVRRGGGPRAGTTADAAVILDAAAVLAPAEPVARKDPA
jgi:chemotaxis signal transduction protein